MKAADILCTNGNYCTEEINLFEQAIQYRDVTKGELICQPGKIAKSVYFNTQGAVYQCVHLKGDLENIIDLYPEAEWFLNHNSFIAQKPSDSFIKAYTDGTLLELNIISLHWLISKSTAFLQLAKIFEQHRTIYFDNKLTPAEKYQYVLEQRPSLIQLFPLKMIASYLKITPETLSRVRDQLSKQKKIS